MRIVAVIFIVLALGACSREPAPVPEHLPTLAPAAEQTLGVSVDRFADVERLREVQRINLEGD